MKAAIFEPGLEMALGLGIPGGAQGNIVRRGKDMRNVPTPCPTRQCKGGRKGRDMLGSDAG